MRNKKLTNDEVFFLLKKAEKIADNITHARMKLERRLFEKGYTQ